MKTSVAILGAGIGQQHLDAYLSLDDRFAVMLLVDQDLQRAASVAGSAEIETCAHIETALDDPDIDLIDICLPPHLHVPVALRALQAGKHVICEKPLATSLKDAFAMRAAAQKAGRKVYPVFQYRWGAPLAQLRHLISSGQTGKAQLASVETHWSRGADYYAVPWRGTWAGEQGGAVLGHAIHNHDLLMHFLGPIAALSAMTTTRVNDIETEDCASIAFEMRSGALATSSITLGAAGNETRLRFVFENLMATSGTAPYAPGAEPWHFVARDPAMQPDVDHALKNAPTEPTGFEGFLTQVALDQSGAENSAVSLEEGIGSIELVTAIYHAARTGERVPLPLREDHTLFGGWQP